MDNDDIHQVKSLYPLDDFGIRLKKYAEADNLIITNKNKADELLARVGIQPSERSRIISLAKDTLSQSEANVKQNNGLAGQGTVLCLVFKGHRTVPCLNELYLFTVSLFPENSDDYNKVIFADNITVRSKSAIFAPLILTKCKFCTILNSEVQI